MPSLESHWMGHAESVSPRLERFLPLLTGLAAIAVLASIAVSQILMGIALLVLLLSRQPLEFPPSLRYPLLAFAGWTLLSLAFSTAPWMGLPQVRKLFVFFIPLLVCSSFQSTRQISRLLQGVVVGGAISAAYGLFQFAQQYLELQQQGLSFYENYVANQATGLMSHWMTFSGELMLVLILLVSYLLFYPRAAARVWGWLFLLVLGAGLLVAFTRGMWLGALTGTAYLIARRRRKALWLLPVALLLLYLLSPSWLQRRERSVFDTETDSSIQARLVMARTGLRMIAAHPVLGVGPERVGPEFLQYKTDGVALPEGYYGHLHNTYLQIAAERGIPCLLILLWLYFEVLRDGFRVAKKQDDPEACALGHGGVAITAGMMVAGLFEYNFGDSEVLMLYLFLISALLCRARLNSLNLPQIPFLPKIPFLRHRSRSAEEPKRIEPHAE